MLKIITGFKTKKDVEKTLKWVEKNTDFCWWVGNKPTKWYVRERAFQRYQSEGGFYIEYQNYFGFGSIDCLTRNVEEYKEMNFKDLIGEERSPKEGDEVLVRGHRDKYWEKRILISKLPERAERACIVVSEGYEKKYRNGEKYDVVRYEQMKKLGEKIKKEVEATEMQWEEIEKILG